MKVIYTKAYAKLNLSLDVLSKRPDGYHDLCMVMQSVEHHDDVSILLNLDGQFYAQSDRRYLPNDERNIALRAARLFLEETGHADMGASVRLRKRIPVCAGLGGGSSDAAAVLRALNEHFDRPLSCEALEQLGMKLGMDVPYCIAGGT
ncbi:MAG: 4-(cytidine 5'-diphospho)-2-C-methyl-D-erythritol kinase, partial [Oscillospiraceae bacterium]|nr:4-(cytidine 5'-diphospho)-2-C-methyl-D-erythritol kinase [Oscillospiraceae bacterium]